jgi:hypothetical protein
MPVYQITITAPAINDEVVLAAESEHEARALAVSNALGRQAKEATVTVTEVPPEPEAA